MPILILVWIHGFKGSDQTFQGFPERVCSVLRSSNKNLQVHNSVYPSYETRGDLDSCVDAFVDWLTLLTAETESNADNKAEKARVVLMGHRFVILFFLYLEDMHIQCRSFYSLAWADWLLPMHFDV